MCDFGKSGSLEFFDRSKLGEQLLGSYFSDIGDLGKLGCGKMPGALVPVECNGKAVGFVPGLLDELKGFRLFIDVEREGISGKENFLQAFCDTDYRDFSV